MIYNGKHHEFIMQQMSDLRCPLCLTLPPLPALVTLCVVSCLIWLHLLPPVAGMRSKNEERERGSEQEAEIVSEVQRQRRRASGEYRVGEGGGRSGN